jgi:beta-lactamase class A
LIYPPDGHGILGKRPQRVPSVAPIVTTLPDLSSFIPADRELERNNVTTRRNFVRGASAVAGSGWLGVTPAWSASDAKLLDTLSAIERTSGGRLGVAVLDTGSGALTGLHADDRFPMCSTFKMLACSAVLKRVDEGKEKLDRRITIKAQDVVPGSSFIKAPVGGDGMALADICEAAMIYSDNTAGNIILASIDGPQGLTAYARSIGDSLTRLDRNEPTLNEAVPGDPRDTTTPAVMLKSVQKLVLGTALSSSSRDQLTKWMVGNKTGDARIRAGLPAGWRCGDKTGAGERGTTNDIAVLWPPGRPPIVVTIYLTNTTADTAKRNGTLAAVGRAIAGGPDKPKGSGTY